MVGEFFHFTIRVTMFYFLFQKVGDVIEVCGKDHLEM
jgi:hypothetical protein